ncbi:MFS transporter [Neobacillus sp. LXY-4]|uniref:MFS transporter n=1 Tax=Neobacillus sp. LXY-4 TaxID=3379826 RepID=UPI003EE2E750
MEHKQTSGLISLASVPLVMTLGNSMLIPVLPIMEKKLDITPFQSSLIITIYSGVAIILIPIAGYLSDRIGRKKVIIPSLIAAGIGGVISGWASWKMNDPYLMILVGRVLQGIGAAGASPIVLPLIGDMFCDEKEVSSGLGLIETSNTVGKVLSPILGAFLASIFWFLPFLAFPIFCLLSILLVGIFIKAPKEKEEPPKFKVFLNSIKNIFKRDARWLFTIFTVGGICMFILFGMLFYLSSLLEEIYHIEGIKKGGVLAIPLAALSLSSYITGKTIGENKSLMKWITFFGLLLSTLALWSTSFSKNIYFLITTLAVSGIGIGASLPCLDALITSGFKKKERGTVSSIYSSMRFVGVALGPPIFAILRDYSHKSLFFSVTGISIITAILALFFIKPPKPQSEKRGLFEKYES